MVTRLKKNQQVLKQLIDKSHGLDRENKLIHDKFFEFDWIDTNLYSVSNATFHKEMLLKVRTFYNSILDIIKYNNDIKVSFSYLSGCYNFNININFDLPCINLSFNNKLNTKLAEYVKIHTSSSDDFKEQQIKAFDDLSIKEQIEIFLIHLNKLENELDTFINYWNEEVN